jgi:uncharacterized ferredoxin-like protein
MTPPIVDSRSAERGGILEAARLMLISARTAPKSAGIDDVLAVIVYGKEKDAIADKMEQIGKKRKVEAFMRDAKNTRDSEIGRAHV